MQPKQDSYPQVRSLKDSPLPSRTLTLEEMKFMLDYMGPRPESEYPLDDIKKTLKQLNIGQ